MIRLKLCIALIPVILALVATPVMAQDWEASGIDGATSALVGIDYAHHEIHGGSSYYNERFVQVPAGDVLDIRFWTGNTTKWSHFIAHIITEAEFHVNLYEDVEAFTTAGITLTAVNRDRNSSKTSNWQYFDYILTANAAAANVTTDMTGCINIGKAASGSGRNKSGEGGHEEELILKQDTKYVLRFESRAQNERYVDYVLDWYEHTNRAEDGDMYNIELIAVVLFLLGMIALTFHFKSWLLSLPTILLAFMLVPQLQDSYDWYVAGPVLLIGFILMLRVFYNTVAGKAGV